MKIKIIICMLLWPASFVFAQDTIRLMHYNLMYYRQTTSYCTSSNNNPSQKDTYLKTIIKYVKPDIFTANEVGPNTASQQLLDNCLNVDGVTYYKKTNYINYSGSDLGNMLYYNNNKVGFISSTAIVTTVRDINIYKLYFKTADLSTTHDTAYVTIFVVHLKAGSTTNDMNERAKQTKALMDYLNGINKKGNYILTGDLNVTNSAEECFQNLINYSNNQVRFYDPINQIGFWGSNYSYRMIHTQSTHKASSGCFSTGGLDDRFDFILVSEDIKNGSKKVKSVQESYIAVGQDGNHYNGEINAGTNNSAPQDVIDALYGMSDHLPVFMKIAVGGDVAVNGLERVNIEAWIENPSDDMLKLILNLEKPELVKLKITSVTGQILFTDIINQSEIFIRKNISIHSLQQGLYYLTLSAGNRNKSIPFVIIR